MIDAGQPNQNVNIENESEIGRLARRLRICLFVCFGHIKQAPSVLVRSLALLKNNK